MSGNETIQQAINLVKAGRRSEARALVEQILEHDPDNVGAWAVMAQAAQDREETVAALKQVLRLRPDDAWAQGRLAQLDDRETVMQAANLARTGWGDRARTLVEGVLERNPDNVGAWIVLAQLTDDREEAIHALKQVLRIDPDDDRVQRYLARLEREQAKEEEEDDDDDDDDDALPFWMLPALAGVAGILLIAFLILALPLLLGRQTADTTAQEDAVLNEVADLPMSSCRELIERAMLVSDESCRRIGGNEVCYGNYDVDAELTPGFGRQFDLVGDVIPVETLRKLSASPLDLEEGLWGIAVFKLRANLPGTVPGQNVTFLVFGDTSLENASGDLSAFYFSTGFGSITCDQVPFDGLLVEMPDGAGISFQVNGTDLTLMGTTTLQAEQDGEMTVTMLDGTGTVSSGGKEVEIGPGTSVSVPLDGVEASGPPSEPETLPDIVKKLGCALLGVGCPPPDEGVAEDSPNKTPTQFMTNTPIPSPTRTLAPGETPEDTPVPTRTLAPGETPENTAVPTNTRVPTNTPVPTNTRVPTNTPVPTSPPTNTPVPTNTPLPTDTPVPTATTAPPFNCSSIDLVYVEKAKWRIINNNGVVITLSRVQTSWPAGNNNLKKINLVGEIWSGDVPPPSADLSLTSPLSNRQVPPAGSALLKLTFDVGNPADTGYTLTLTFVEGGGCTLPTFTN